MDAAFAKVNLGVQRFFSFIDKLTDKVSPYRLVLYFLGVLAVWTIILSFFDAVPFEWYEIVLSAGWLILVCRYTNIFIAKKRNIPVNAESDIITALILALIFTPPQNLKSWVYITLAGLVAIASKYLISVGRKHIFNPAAFGAFIVGILFGYWPSWWVGTDWTAPLLLLGGLLILRKMERLDMIGVFLGVYIVLAFLQLVIDIPLPAVLESIWAVLTASSLLFFAVIMLTEPLTSPKTRNIYLLYAALVGVLYSVTNFGLRPEQALLLGNLAAFIFDPNPRREFKFVGRKTEADGIESFIFEGKKGLKFKPGQHMEWTLPQYKADSRGNRRYLTISSSPTESQVMFTLRIPEKMSSFKASLESLKKGDTLLAGQLAGNFTLPNSEKQKLAFLAGGVGITPFRSMVKYAKDFDQQRDMVLLYLAGSSEEFAFKDLFDEAQSVGLKTVYALSSNEVPKNWHGSSGAISPKVIKEVYPDFKERLFYISGPYGFVAASKNALYELGVSRKQIITDYFPGYS